MIKPVLLAVDDDPEVARASERDLRRRYADKYRVIRSESGTTALETLKQLRQRNTPVALLLSDQRMPQMDGVTFLEKARELFPNAKRALPTASPDTEIATKAFNQRKTTHYLPKPWNQPQEMLCRILHDLLD